MPVGSIARIFHSRSAVHATRVFAEFYEISGLYTPNDRKFPVYRIFVLNPCIRAFLLYIHMFRTYYFILWSYLYFFFSLVCNDLWILHYSRVSSNFLPHSFQLFPSPYKARGFSPKITQIPQCFSYFLLISHTKFFIFDY